MRQTFRMALCRMVEEAPDQTTEQLMTALHALYPGERQVNSVPLHLQALRAVGIVRTSREELAGEREHPCLVQHWELTTSGRQRLHRMMA